MRVAVAIVSFALIIANVCGPHQEPAHAAEIAASGDLMWLPVRDDQAIAGVISGQFYIYRTSQTLDCKAGLFLMTQLAEAGNAEAMFELADLYETGSCVQASNSKAHAWFRKAAQNGSTEGVSALGKFYYLGSEDIAPDYEKALWWLSRGVIRLDRDACYYLALMYKKGMGVGPNYKEAYKLFDLSMRLSPFLSDDREAALAARDSAREMLTPREVVDAASASKLLLIALLEHDHRSAERLLPQEAFTALHVGKR
jgi:TPR repeat protein